LLSPSLLAEIEQVPDASETLITPVFAFTAQPVEPVALKVSTPVPEPPSVVAVPVVPKVTLAGTVKLSAVCVAFFSVTDFGPSPTGPM